MRISLDEPLQLPRPIVTRSFTEKDVHVAVENPAWIVTDHVQSRILAGLISGLSVREAALDAYRSSGERGDAIEAATRGLLQKIEEREFYADRTRESTALAMHAYLTNECNLHCIHCYKNAGSRMQDELSTEEWKRIFGEFTELRDERGVRSNIVLSGGEVLKRADFFDLLSYVKERKHRVSVVSNGTLLTSADDARRLAENVDMLQFSLDGATREMNDRFRGKGTYDRVIEAINLFEPFEDYVVSIGMTVSGLNVADIEGHLPELMSRIRKRKVRLNISSLMEYGRGNACVERFGKDTSYVDRVFAAARSIGIEQDLRVEPNVRAHDCGYARAVTIDANGNVFYCPVGDADVSANVNVRNWRMHDLFELFEAQNLRAAVEEIPGCGDCELKYLCGGGCRLEHIKVQGDLLTTGCGDERKDWIYRELLKRE